MIDDRTIKNFLAQGGQAIAADGTWSAADDAAAKAWLLAKGIAQASGWPPERCKIAVQQSLMGAAGITVGTIDGLIGPTFRFAIEQWQNKLRDTVPAPAAVAHQPPVWPRQADVPAFYGAPGSSLVAVQLPYPMLLSWDATKTVRTMQLHAKVADSARRALTNILDHYGLERIRALRLDRYGGSYNQRPMRGGTQLSMHSWGIAIDFDPDRNQLRWGRDQAAMAGPDYKAFLDCWAAEGWISLGRERNYDWMHVQAARL
ncbi:MAG: M15 family metallopeptidase [Sphingomonadales bacterium]